MQLVGKLALTATAALILALAFRFYKSRVHERSGAADGGGGGHSGYQDVAGGDHLNDETNQLRRRGVRRNLHGDVTSSAGSQRPAGDPLTAQESEGGPIGGYQIPDVISAGQSDLNNQSPETGDIALSGHECHRESHQGLGCSGREVCNGNGTIRDNGGFGVVQPGKDSGKDISVGTIRDNAGSKSLPIDSAKDIHDGKGSGTIRDNADLGTVQSLKDSGKGISVGTIRDNEDLGTVQSLKDSGKGISVGTIRDNEDLGTVQSLKDSGKGISVGTIRDNSDSKSLPIDSAKDGKGSGTIRDNADPGTVQSLKDSGKDISDVKETGTIKGNANCESGKKICDGKGSGTIRDNVDSGTVQTLNDSGKDISDVKGIGTIKANAKCGNIQSLQGFVKDICDEFGIGTIRDNSDSENIQLPNDSGNDICDGKGIGATKDNTSSGIIQTVTESIRPCKEKGIGTIGDNSDSENLRINNLKDTGDGKVEKTTVDHVDSGDLQPVRESGKDPIDETENGTIWNNHRPEVTTANVDSGSLIQDLQSSSGISLALNENHKTMQEVHRFSSVSRVVVEENIIGERQVEESRTSPRSAGLRGKVYEYHIESTSETVSPEKHFKFRASVSPSKCPQAGQQDNQEVKVGQGQDHGGVLGPKLGQFSADLFTVSQESLEAKGNSTPSGLISPLRSLAPKGALNTKPSKGNSVFHVSLSPESTFDVYLGLENCLEVLSLAKKHDLDVLKTAAYKVMSDNYLDVLQNPSVYGRLHAAERDLILEKRMRGRRYVVVADVDTMGYSVPGDSTLSYYDSDRDSWHLLCPMPPEAVSRACSMATMFNYIFIVLGCQGLEREMKPSQRVVCYNPVTGQWQDICPLNEARPHCKLVELDGYLYAIGGECLHTVERYDPRQNRWSYVAPLPNDTFAVAHMATSYDDEIYVTGGTIRYLLLRYQRRDNTWKSSVITGSKDRTTELVAANNFLYRFDVNRSVGISVHRCSVRARIWYECATYAMPYPLPFQCAVVDNNIYLISRNFHLRFLTDDISPRFMEDNLKTLPCPKGLLSPLVLVLPGVDSQ
uniref:Kelch domain-containing 7A n=1 Tax=Xenopus tropicalis TaxID=8364 RepID=A0A1B8XYK4_XENTR